MKKTYIIPNTQCVKIQTVNMIAQSLGSLGIDGGTVSTYDTELEAGTSSDSRRGSIWSDED